MSDLTQCNYCTLQNIRRRALDNEKVTTLWGRGGINVHVYPKDINIKSISDSERSKYKRVWFKELSDHCVC